MSAQELRSALESNRNSTNRTEFAQLYLEGLDNAGFEILGEYDAEDMVQEDTGIAKANERNRNDGFQRPEVDPRLTFRLQDYNRTPNETSAEAFPDTKGLADWMVTGDLRIPVEGPVDSEIAAGKTKIAETLTAEDPYIQPGERSVDLFFYHTDINPPGTIPKSLQNLREISEAMAYTQNLRLPPQMAISSFQDRIDSTREPETSRAFEIQELNKKLTYDEPSDAKVNKYLEEPRDGIERGEYILE